jgi:hypothetical protein
MANLIETKDEQYIKTSIFSASEVHVEKTNGNINRITIGPLADPSLIIEYGNYSFSVKGPKISNVTKYISFASVNAGIYITNSVFDNESARNDWERKVTDTFPGQEVVFTRSEEVTFVKDNG